MSALTKKIINTLLGVAVLLGLIWFLLSRIFPEDIDVKPVLNESSEIQKEAQKLNKKVITDDYIESIKPINPIPFIELQPYKQPANEDVESSYENYKFEHSSNIKIEQRNREDKQESKTVKRKSEATERIGSYPLDEEVPRCTELEVILCINNCCSEGL